MGISIAEMKALFPRSRVICNRADEVDVDKGSGEFMGPTHLTLCPNCFRTWYHEHTTWPSGVVTWAILSRIFAGPRGEPRK